MSIKCRAQVGPSHNFIPEIKNSNEVYDIGCLCEIRIGDTKEFGVNLSLF